MRTGSKPSIVIAAAVMFVRTSAGYAAHASDWAGKYISEKITVEFVASSETTLSGTIVLSNQHFPLVAHLDGERLLGSFSNDGHDYAFTAVRNGDELKLLTGGVFFTLKSDRASSTTPRNPLLDAAAPSTAPISRPARPAIVETAPVARTDSPRATTPRPERRDAPRSGDTIVLKNTDVFDPMIGCNALSLLVPKGWKLEGGIGWRQHPFYPAFANMRVSDPNSAAAVTIYPMLVFNDGIRESTMQQTQFLGPDAVQFMANAFPEGGNYMGAEVRKRVSRPVDYVTQFIVPRFRHDLAGVRVVSVQDLPEYAKSKAAAWEYDQLPGAEWRASRVRMAYQLAGRGVEEDFVCFLASVPILNMISWSAEVESYRAAAGQLDRTMPIFRTMDHSIKLNLKWFSAQLQVAQMIQENIRQAGRQAVELSHYISRVNDEISDIIRSSYENRQRTLDRCNENFDKMIRGVETYATPFRNDPIEVPSGYDRVFTNPLGEIIVTNDTGFDPGTISNQDWRELHKTE